jgi:hypothetical protein
VVNRLTFIQCCRITRQACTIFSQCSPRVGLLDLGAAVDGILARAKSLIRTSLSSAWAALGFEQGTAW